MAPHVLVFQVFLLEIFFDVYSFWTIRDSIGEVALDAISTLLVVQSHFRAASL